MEYNEARFSPENLKKVLGNQDIHRWWLESRTVNDITKTAGSGSVSESHVETQNVFKFLDPYCAIYAWCYCAAQQGAWLPNELALQSFLSLYRDKEWKYTGAPTGWLDRALSAARKAITVEYMDSIEPTTDDPHPADWGAPADAELTEDGCLIWRSNTNVIRLEFDHGDLGKLTFSHVDSSCSYGNRADNLLQYFSRR